MSMAGYTKLFNSILASTIWREDDKTRIVWITLLAMADKNGIAESSIPGLADMARVSIEDCEASLLKLQSPDKYSRTKDFDGRRIEPTDGGWRLLNHGKYRAKMSADERREYNRIKQQEHRATRQTLSTDVNDSNQKSALSAHTEAEAEAEAVKTKTPQPTAAECEEIYKCYPLKVGKPVALKAIGNAIKAGTSFQELLEKTQAYSLARNGNLEFVPHPSTWFNQRRFNDDPSTWKPNNGNSQTTKPNPRNIGVAKAGPSYGEAARRLQEKQDMARQVAETHNQEQSETAGT